MLRILLMRLLPHIIWLCPITTLNVWWTSINFTVDFIFVYIGQKLIYVQFSELFFLLTSYLKTCFNQKVIEAEQKIINLTCRIILNKDQIHER